MSKFEKSEWAEKKHAQEFMENADIYVLERQRMFTILKSFYRFFLMKNSPKSPIKVMDLGCGAGALTQELFKEDENIHATLVDGSEEMLKNARENLRESNNLTFVHKTFQELINGGNKDIGIDDNFDLVVSSLAIHHLHYEEKKLLFEFIHQHLKTGGFFLNIETVKAPTDQLEKWYRIIWREWIVENQAKLGVEESFEYLPEQYRDNPDNHPDQLQEQLDALKNIGFKQVDCYFKYGIFTIYGGMK